MAGDKRITELPAAGELTLDDLLAVVHNGVTSRVTLRDLIKELQIDIPQPRIRIRRDIEKTNFGHDEVFAYWEGSDNRFLKYNPEFWLYRYKKAQLRTIINKETNNREKRWVKKRFVHPSHQHGQGKLSDSDPTDLTQGPRYYGGAYAVPTGSGVQTIAIRNTEWAVDSDPFSETKLNLEPWKWYRVKGMASNAMISPQSFPRAEQPTPRGTGSSKSRMVVFKARIAIDNPHPESGHPKIFGPFSETFILYPHKSGGLYRGFKFFLGSEGAPQLRYRN
ncbi:MAG: hypothetical protein AAGN35_08430 [Bacteroidota bacterium]